MKKGEKVQITIRLRTIAGYATTFLVAAMLFIGAGFVFATTPNPGHPWTEVGNGFWQAANTQTALRTFTFPDADATVLTSASVVTAAQGGTGTTTYSNGGVLFYNSTFGTIAQNASNFYWDSANRRLGIGTTTPNNLLTLAATNKSAIEFSGGSTKGSFTMGFDATNNRFSIASSSALGTNDMFIIDSVGDVMVGTTTKYGISATQPATFTIDANNVATEEGLNILNTYNGFFEGNIKNSSTGASAQSCWTATSNQGTDTSGFVAICTNSSGFWNPQTYNVGGPGDTSIMGLSTNDFYIAQGTSGKKMYFLNGGVSTSTNLAIAISGVKVGIASSSPSAQLSIGGTAGTDGIMFPDGTMRTTGVTDKVMFTNVGLHAANVTAVTALTSGTSYFEYVGVADKAYTSCTILQNVTTAGATITWAEVALFTGVPPMNTTASLSRVGSASVSATYNTTGLKKTTLSSLTIKQGDNLWVVFGSSATTPFQVRGMLADNLQSGVFQTGAVQPSLAATPYTTTLGGASAVPAWIAMKCT